MPNESGYDLAYKNADEYQEPLVTAPTGGATTDAEARTAINAIITVLENLKLVAPN